MDQMAEPEKEERRRPVLSGWMIVLIVLIVAGAAVGITALITHGARTPTAAPSRSSSGQPVNFTATGGNMLPAIHIGQTVSVSLLHGASPQSGDIIVFSPGGTDCAGPSVKYDIARVVGLPGQTVSLSGGYVNIDGRRLNETWLANSEQGVTYPGPPRHPSFNLQHAYKVPARSYYVMGDNRTYSCDSRYWGPVSASSVLGIAHVP